MLEVYEFSGAWGVPSASPFCLKLTTWLRLAGIPYRSVIADDPRKAPKGKLPYVNDEGEVLGDSGIIIERLRNKHAVTLDEHLSVEQRAHAHALCRTFEDSLYFVLVYLRWIADDGWAAIQKPYFGSLPAVVRGFVPRIARRQVRRTLHGQGMGRHSEAEVHGIARADLDAVSATLGDRDYLFGEVSSIDAVAYGFLENLRRFSVASPTRQRIEDDNKLVAYCDRIRARCWS